MGATPPAFLWWYRQYPFILIVGAISAKFQNPYYFAPISLGRQNLALI
jgi:hypothetical protein